MNINATYNGTCNSRVYKKVSHITCFNFDKKDYYMDKYFKSKKNNNIIEN